MIDLGPFESCVCQRPGQPSDSCADRLVIQEKGKKVTLRPRTRESAKLLILDACVIKDNLPKCDALFLYEKRNQLHVVLVELKGADIDHAFEQISYTKENRAEYHSIKDQVLTNRNGRLMESAFVVSNHKIDRVTHQKLENRHKVRVRQVLHSEATRPMPDLREWL